MRLTLEDILKRVGGYVDQDAVTPTGTDLTNRINYANRALGVWAKTLDWEELNQTNAFTISEASFVSLALPTNFDKPMSALFYYKDNAEKPRVYTLIPKDERSNYDTSDEVAYIDGDIASNYHVIVPKGLPSGASVTIDIKVHPSSYATLADIAQIPDAEYVVDSVIALVLEARADERFPLVKGDADRKLAAMVESYNVKNLGRINRIPTTSNFVIGE